MKRLVIIDGKSVFYRGYYAMGALSTSEGVPTGGVYGFAAIAMEIVRQLNPTKVVVAWDSKSSTAKRKALYKDYKAGRVKPGEDFYAQIPYLEELVKALGWNFVEIDEYEADDIIGTLSLQADELSACKEAPVSSRATSLSRSSSTQSQGLKPSSFRASDSPRISTEISTGFEREKGDCGVRRGKEDLGLDDKGCDSDDCEKWETYIVSSDLDMLQVVDENTKMYRILKGFSKLEELDVAGVEAKYGIKKAQFLDLKALKGDASDNIPGVPGIGEKTAVKLLNEYGDLKGIYEHLDEVKGATRKKLEEGREGAEMSYKLAKIMTDAPVRLEDLPDLVIDKERIIAALKKLEFRTLVGKFMKMMPAEETQVKATEKVKAEKKPSGSSNSVLNQQTLEIPRYLDDGTLVSWNVKDLMHKNANVAEKILAGGKFWDLGQGSFLLNPLERSIEYGDEVAEYERQKAEFAKLDDVRRIFEEFDLPLIPVLYRMEKAGMLIDREYFGAMKREFAAEVQKLEQRIWDLAGQEFNVNSPVQLSEVLFTKLGLPTKGIKKTQRGYSTGVKELDKLEGSHEIVGAIKEYREVAKLLSTYIIPLPELADANGRVHTTFNQNVTATGRLSSTNPNLQNIPVRTEEGRRIRTGFIAGDGKVLVSADYSQFELRLAAVLAGDEALIADFNNDIDVHTKTAAEAFGVSMAEVTKAQRRAAKVINFGILYGMSVRGLSAAAGMSYDEARQFIDNYFELRKPIKIYLEKLLKQAHEKGYVETIFGRRRPTPDVESSNFIVRTGAERAAQNMPIQGTEADLMKRAMLRVAKKLPEEAEMVMQVHDSLIVECDEKMADEVQGILKEEMENVAPELAVKLKVDVSVGGNWGEL